MNSKRKLFTPLILALGLVLIWLTVLNVNSLPSSRAWAAAEELESKANGTPPYEGNEALLYEESAASDEVSITSVSPDYGWNDEETAIYINLSELTSTMELTVTLLGREITVTDTEVLSDRIIAVVPAGLPPGWYDVTVELANGEKATLPNGFQVKLASPHNDLVSFAEWLWTEPFQLTENTTNGMIGLNVQRLGGRETWKDVQVCFELDIPGGAQDLGCNEVPFLAPNTVAATKPVRFTPSGPRQYTICAEIEKISTETDKSNNRICRTFTIQNQIAPWREDDVPPKVNEFVIEDGAETTTERTCTLDVTATDQETPGKLVSGMRSIEFIEFVYPFDAQRWVPVQRSGWVPYLTAHENYPWTLTTTYGVRYMEAWAVDKAGNISNPSVNAPPGIDMINLVPEEQVGFVAKNEVVFYRMFLEEGDTFEAILTPISGDPDLYVWGPSDKLWVSSNPTDVDSVVFEAPDTGTYQIEVHGYDGDAKYRLIFGIIPGATTEPLRAFQDESKPEPDGPVVTLDNTPQSIEFNNTNLSPTYAIYLPMTSR